MIITITDNTCRKKLTDICNRDLQENELNDLKKIGNINIKDISLDKDSNLLIFPQNFNQYHDDIHTSNIFDFDCNNKTLTTNNIMGFIGINNIKISIRSRFTKECSEDFFLHYMLQKVFAINLFDLKTTTDSHNIFDFFLYLFPYFLKKAINQGLFKKYKTFKYNNSNIKGCVDIPRHIRLNPKFNGNIAYNTREYSSDNYITQLIRHTIEFIKTHKYSGNILSVDQDTISAVSQINSATNSYIRNDRLKVINQNLKTLNHPYFYEYTFLQKICLQILRYEQLKYGQEKDEIYGILFDGAWLWEEYLATILQDFEHPKNKEQKGRLYLFTKGNHRPQDHCYPDFYSKDREIVLDAKYKWDETKDDRKPMVVYMHILSATKGIFILPTEKKDSDTLEMIGTLDGYGGEMWQYSLGIPTCNNFSEFKEGIIKKEEILLKQIPHS